LQRYSYNYKLLVEGLNGIKFNETASLSTNWKESSILIQTDKAMYKPSDRIQFRVLVVDGDTKPVNLDNQPVDAYIQDPKGNKIKQWSNIKLVNGVFKSDLKLSREPAMGYWYLYFSYGSNNNRVTQTKNFEVAEYVLPKYEVITSEPVYNTYKSGKLIFGVEAKYTYGKPVKGTVTVKIDNQQAYYSWNKRSSRGQRPERYTYKVIPINGKAVVELDLKELKIETTTTYMQYKNFDLTVLEELTGISIEKSINVPIYVRDYQITHVGSEQNFKPGLTFSFNVKVTRPDGKPMIDKENPVSVAVYYGFDDKKKTDLSLKLNDQGLAFVSVTAPRSALLLDFVIKYRDADQYTIYLPRAESESNNFIQANVLTKP
jgi:CD109 antigen